MNNDFRPQPDNTSQQPQQPQQQPQQPWGQPGKTSDSTPQYAATPSDNQPEEQSNARQQQSSWPTGSQPAGPGASPGQAAGENPDKSYLVALLLSYFLGAIGADRFYLNKIGTGVLKLVTLGGLGIWQLVDLILIAFNKLHAKNDSRPLEGYAHNRSWVKLLAIVLIVFNLVVLVLVMKVFVTSIHSGRQSANQATQSNSSSTGARPSLQESARNTEREIDLKSMQRQLEAHFNDKGYYPSVAQLNDPLYRSREFKLLDPAAYKDPSGTSDSFASVPTQGQYVYEAIPTGCDNTAADCVNYKLIATMEAAEDLVVSSPY